MINSFKVLPFCICLPLFLFGEDYSYPKESYGFDMDELETIELKSYQYSGYLKSQYKYLDIKNQSNIDSYIGETMVDFKYYNDKLTINSEFMANYENIDDKENKSSTVNQLYLNYSFNKNHFVNIGKVSSKWGKGYFFNPIAFVDRKKDPNNPELTKEGYELLGYKYNKVYTDSNLKNFTFDLIYLPTSSNQNNDFYDNSSKNIALKSYFLYFDTDIDIAYLYSNKMANKIGIDFSTNIETNFEFHGEAVRDTNGLYSYLLGIKYLTVSDLTITSEYFYQNETLNQIEPFWDNRYFLNKLSQKEPFDILYSTIYYKNSLNINDKSYQNSIGFTYKFNNNIDTDLFIGNNKGKEISEYGSKKVSKFFSFELKWSF